MHIKMGEPVLAPLFAFYEVLKVFRIQVRSVHKYHFLRLYTTFTCSVSEFRNTKKLCPNISI